MKELFSVHLGQDSYFWKSNHYYSVVSKGGGVDFICYKKSCLDLMVIVTFNFAKNVGEGGG